MIYYLLQLEFSLIEIHVLVPIYVYGGTKIECFEIILCLLIVIKNTNFHMYL